ncbi:type II toxin-antitoxin system VapC family toxin [Leptospira kanakyensis]|uniref:Type II toxin-antitoxin system VapC family toxin n=1 Tax=Leptospira kanakyensis TaxID=2484968 RepID=A0A6N4QPC1_9LEPT|nr:type II toxin-antitoxin system VapC family toxin [Leptospira kanakyensis]TGK54368.1 type II toxin-antitoxin system VapC family toxin [Leptospira kanakyensis]TGK58913.1 type II toxin-antitoxin system VapC family toxin [Leptospira kanakyensis]TGK75314.1 type II toxin-antitoxin system VapC family toxin [Leptospira kanakyensis]
MKYLLDTHTYLWILYEPANLSKKVLRIVENPENELYLSVASIWEIIIKFKIGKLNLQYSPDKIISESLVAIDCNVLEITMGHTFGLLNLPDLHKDPFDRILVCQSNFEKMAILTKDSLITQYEINSIW